MASKKPFVARLRHRVIFQKSVKTPDGAGGFVEEYEDIITCWAEVLPMSARKRFYSDQLNVNTTHQVTTRALSELLAMKEQLPHCRVVFGDRIFQIHGVLNDREKNLWLEYQCEEKVGS